MTNNRLYIDFIKNNVLKCELKENALVINVVDISYKIILHLEENLHEIYISICNCFSPSEIYEDDESFEPLVDVSLLEEIVYQIIKRRS